MHFPFGENVPDSVGCCHQTQNNTYLNTEAWVALYFTGCKLVRYFLNLEFAEFLTLFQMLSLIDDGLIGKSRFPTPFPRFVHD